MQVKLVDAVGVPGGKAVALCDDDGEILGDQVRAVTEFAAGEFPTITVTLQIDGNKVRLAL